MKRHLLQPSKHAGSDLHLNWIGSIGLKQARRFLHSGLHLDQIHLAKTRRSVRTKLDLGWFCTIWSWLSVKVSVGNW